jgi:hypothetical protein
VRMSGAICPCISTRVIVATVCSLEVCNHEVPYDETNIGGHAYVRTDTSTHTRGPLTGSVSTRQVNVTSCNQNTR